MAADEAQRQAREQAALAHMTAENAHDFTACIGAFAHPRYELVATSELYDGAARVNELLLENKTGFPDFRFDVEKMHHADDAIIVEGTFRATHLGTWRGLPATGRPVEVPMAIIFRFEGVGMICERVFFDLMTVLRQLGVAHDPNSFGGKLMTMLNHPVTLGKALARKLGSGR